MAQVSTITAELVGRRYPEFKFLIHPLWVRDYKEALGYGPEQVADENFVPKSFVSCLRDSEFATFDALDLALSQLLHAGQYFTYFDSIQVGDLITSQNEISRVLAKRGRVGEMVFMDFKNTFRRRARRGQAEPGDGIVVAESLMSVIVRDVPK